MNTSSNTPTAPKANWFQRLVAGSVIDATAEATAATVLTAAQTIVPGFDAAVNAAAKAGKTDIQEGRKMVKAGTDKIAAGAEALAYAQTLGSKVTVNPPANEVK